MGDEVGGVPETPALSGEPTGSIGTYLARQRRLRGISLDDLAESTKIPRRSLERMESGAFDGQSDGFSRGFVRTIADALGLDSEDAIMRMLGEPPDADEDGRRNRPSIPRWLLIAGGVSIALLLIFGAHWLWQHTDLPGGRDDDSARIVYRRDAVRALAREHEALQQPPGDLPEVGGAPVRSEPIGSRGDAAN